eukprot:217842-Heterocapsa_arctica.AAC.1
MAEVHISPISLIQSRVDPPTRMSGSCTRHRAKGDRLIHQHECPAIARDIEPKVIGYSSSSTND